MLAAAPHPFHRPVGAMQAAPPNVPCVSAVPYAAASAVAPFPSQRPAPVAPPSAYAPAACGTTLQLHASQQPSPSGSEMFHNVLNMLDENALNDLMPPDDSY